MKQPNKDTFMVVNLSEMVPANEKARPYVEALESGAELTKPLIKYGVNPASGVPLTDEFMATVVDSTACLVGHPPYKTGLECFAPAVIGERRKVLTDIFFVRSSMLFNNMVDALNVQFDKELRYRFSEIHKKLSEQYYSPWDEDKTKNIVRIVCHDVFVSSPYQLNYDNRNSDDFGDNGVGRNRSKMSKLVDLDYYRRMPLGTILESVLPLISFDYSRFINRINDTLITPSGLGLMAIDYNDFIQFAGMCYANVLSCAESVVKLLFDEANALIEAGHLGEYGVEYDELMNAQLKALKESEHKVRVDDITETLKANPELVV